MKTYRELHPIKEGKRKWRFVVTKRIELPLYGLGRMHPNCMLYVHGKLVALILDGKLFIYPGYAWNGCSPKRYIGWPPIGAWVGTPDFPETRMASLGHDVLFQFSALLRYSMNVVNDQFGLWMDDAGLSEELRDIYYGAVHRFGADYWGKPDPSLSVEWMEERNHDSHDDPTYNLQ
jgi:hypothetical protein